MISRFFELDVEYSQRLRITAKPGWLKSTAAVTAHSGDSWLWFIGLGALWFFGPDGLKQPAAVLFLGILTAAVIVGVLKYTIRRQRPEGEWGGIYRRTDPHSFPSGHATRAILVAVMALKLTEPLLGVLLLIWAILVILARVAMGVHYLSDVIAGTVIGAVLAGVILYFLV